jgi:UDP-N-acetylmuramoyl-tripeptide--D-alanyl-D-alanine ligase
MINNYYIFLAKLKLKKKAYKNLIKIGVTGSYGKTSTKFILETILKEKYNVLATPESYNTTMGNVKVVRNMLKPEHEVFISEMGARYKKDIWEICDIVNPKYAIITSIGPQHLETFKNIDNIVKTKAEILDSLPSDGVAFLSKDNEHCKKLFGKEKREKYSYSMKDKKADVYAKDIILDENGSNFTAVTPIGELKCSTILLGEHNIGNILGCIAIAIKLGLSKEQIEAGVKKIEPIPHRLQMLNSGNGTIVIDDAFNSNPVGAKMAIDVLGKFKGRKIVITPGMVELGTEEKNENKKFGKHMASVVDIAILVGNKRSEPIVEGLREGKFDEQNIYVVADLNAATAKLAELSKIGDVILFENDLPDSYNE